MEAPAQPLKVLLAQAVAVARGLRGVILRAVRLNRQDRATRLIRVHHREVDPVARDAVLRLQIEPALFEPLLDVDLERIKRRRVDRARTERAPAARRVLDVVAQHPHALIVQPVGVHVVGGEAADDRHAPLGAGHRHIKPAEAALLVDRPEVVAHPPVGCAAVADGQNDRVALVALHPLEILDEERLGVGLAEEFVEVRAVAPGQSQRLGDAVGVGCAQRDHPQRLLGAPLGVLKDQSNHPLHFRRVGAADPGCVFLEWHLDMRHAIVRQRAGEGGQAAVVDVVIGEGDQPLILAAVVPAERARAPRHRQQRAHHVENRLDILRQRRVLIVLFVLILAAAGEERGGRQLLGVARHDRLASPQQRGNRVRGRNLARLVEDHHIEGWLTVERQQLGDHQRAHHPARLERGQHIGCLLEKLARRQVPPLAVRLAHDQLRLLRMRIPRRHRSLRPGPHNARRALRNMPPVRLAKLGHRGIMSGGAKRGEFGLGRLNGVQHGERPGILQHLRRSFTAQTALAGRAHDRVEPPLRQPLAQLVQARQQEEHAALALQPFQLRAVVGPIALFILVLQRHALAQLLKRLRKTIQRAGALGRLDLPNGGFWLRPRRFAPGIARLREADQLLAH